jgi:hypothetical protein
LYGHEASPITRREEWLFEDRVLRIFEHEVMEDGKN